jgi:uncharacterized membrane protein
VKESVRRATLIGSCVAASLVIVCTIVGVPQILRIVLGIAIVFALPGFVALSVAGQPLEFSLTEFALGSVGISVAIAVCVAMVLGLTPIGLDRASFAIALGGATLIGSIIALARERRARTAVSAGQ